jgi:hypothetical protein
MLPSYCQINHTEPPIFFSVDLDNVSREGWSQPARFMPVGQTNGMNITSGDDSEYGSLATENAS